MTSTLKDLPTAIDAAGLTPPSLIVVGDCVGLRHESSWFENRPLFGQTIGVTRPDAQCDAVVQKISELSGQPVVMPLIQVGPVTGELKTRAMETIARIADFDWLVFTSVNGVAAFFDLLWESGGDVRRLSLIKLAAIGSSTAAALEERSLRCDVVPEDFRAEDLADAIAPYGSGKRILWARATRGRDVLISRLRDAGALVEDVAVYTNEDAAGFPSDAMEMLKTGQLNWVGLSSPSIARQFAAMLEQEGISAESLTTRVAAISPVTGDAARAAGLQVAVEADVYTWDGILDAICQASA